MRATVRRWIIAIACLLPIGGIAAPPPTAQPIGSWLLECDPAAPHRGCSLRQRDWILPPSPGRPAGALEVQRRGAALVPVVILRGLPAQAALGGLLALQPHATLRFDTGPPLALDCGLNGSTVICAPGADAIAGAAAELPSAHNIAVAVQIGMQGMAPLPAQGRILELQGTREALARLRAAGASGESLPAQPGLNWIGFLNRVLRDAGFENGAADLLSHSLGGQGGTRL